VVEIFFGIITRQAIRRGSFTSVRDLVDAMRIYVDGWNDRLHTVHLDQDRRRDTRTRQDQEPPKALNSAKLDPDVTMTCRGRHGDL